MRFLLVLIGLIFSFIFYIFYTSSIGKNIFLQSSEINFYGSSLFGNLWLQPIIFLGITFFLFIYFKQRGNYLTHNNSQAESTNEQVSIENTYSLQKSVYIILLSYLFIFLLFYIFQINFRIFIFIFLFSIGFYFLGKYLFFHKKINKKKYIFFNIYSIISSYLLSIIGIIYTFFGNNNIIFSGILLGIGTFNIYIHLRYNNIISLLFGVITFIYILYRGIVYIFPGII